MTKKFSPISKIFVKSKPIANFSVHLESEQQSFIKIQLHCRTKDLSGYVALSQKEKYEIVQLN